ncbi:hypothetical protein BO85DRAFT_453863 [Aspergillus piperis CBS 112811]|uniref:Uncharacterized protein n=1 Tax=Aspergillus piperis CBS 112811 TaxID=1448313 RepID=A0A8G1QS03_9EURO|nr:hypothetical protein BO85DRAFT_453863 [Aspergillus piperis CBS 112811]RAH52539.1 hypothetical protein BO85DRAFT_453863 [Aspergillus piperis CBS 112811]
MLNWHDYDNSFLGGFFSACLQRTILYGLLSRKKNINGITESRGVKNCARLKPTESHTHIFSYQVSLTQGSQSVTEITYPQFSWRH